MNRRAAKERRHSCRRPPAAPEAHTPSATRRCAVRPPGGFGALRQAQGLAVRQAQALSAVEREPVETAARDGGLGSWKRVRWESDGERGHPGRSSRHPAGCGWGAAASTARGEHHARGSPAGCRLQRAGSPRSPFHSPRPPSAKETRRRATTRKPEARATFSPRRGAGG
jgi:hypothetical protein